MKYTLQAVEIELHLGTTATERETPQTILFEVSFSADGRAAAASDDIKDAPDYLPMYNAIKAYGGREMDLIETLVSRVYADIVALELPIKNLEVTLTKWPFNDAHIRVTMDKNDV